MADLNIPLNPDPDAGLSAGGYFLPSDIDPNNQTRCDARIAYYDPVQTRSNLHIMPNTHVTRIVFDTSSSPLVATGVEVCETFLLEESLLISDSMQPVQQLLAKQSQRPQKLSSPLVLCTPHKSSS